MLTVKLINKTGNTEVVAVPDFYTVNLSKEDSKLKASIKNVFDPDLPVYNYYSDAVIYIVNEIGNTVASIK